MQDIATLLDEYVAIRKYEADTKKAYDSVKAKRDEISIEIIGIIDQTGGGSREATNGNKIRKGVTRYSKVTNSKSLMKWANEKGNAYVNAIWLILQQDYGIEEDHDQEIFTMQPNIKLLNALLKHYADIAEQGGVALGDILPEGLEQTATEHLVMTKPSKKKIKEKKTETLLEMAIRGNVTKEKE